MKLGIAKEPIADIAKQLQRLNDILLLAEAKDQKVAFSASLPAVHANLVQSHLGDVSDWSRLMSGTIDWHWLCDQFNQSKILSFNVRTARVHIMTAPETERPFYNWDGVFDHRYRLVITVVGELDWSRLSAHAEVRHVSVYSLSTVYLDQRQYPVLSLKRLTGQELSQWLTLLGEVEADLSIVNGEACCIGKLDELPACAGKSAIGENLVFNSVLLFGERSRHTGCLNQTLNWVHGFFAAFGAPNLLGATISREYLRWRTRTSILERTSAGNAVRLEITPKGTSLWVEFEQFSDSDPNATDLKKAFLSAWNRGNHSP